MVLDQMAQNQITCPGSILGPYFYLFILTKQLDQKNSHIVIYADDIALYHRIEDYSQLQDDVTALCKWISDNYLILNASKCCYMTFSKKRFPSYPDTPLYTSAKTVLSSKLRNLSTSESLLHLT